MHEELGRLLVRAGDTSAGIAHLRQALALRPQNPACAGTSPGWQRRRRSGRRRRRLGPELGRGRRRWPRRPLTGGRGGADGAEDAGAAVLLDKQVVRVHRNGLSERFAQRLVQVRTEQAAREELEFHVRYTPGSQEVEIRRARIYRRGPGGELELLQATGRDDRDLSEPWYGLYYDVRAEVVQFEGLRPGDVIEVQYTVADVSSENALADYFGDLEFIAETAPRRRWEYVLIGPAERRFYFNDPPLPRARARRGEEGRRERLPFSAADVPRVVPEPGMPGCAEVAPYLHVSTYASWDEVGRWYWHLVADQLTADDSVRRAARRRPRGARTVADKVRGAAPLRAREHPLRGPGVRHPRLQALQGHPGAVAPLRRLQGQGVAAGGAAARGGHASELVLLRTRRGGRVESSPASLAVFDHAIVYVPALSLYLDGTAEFSGLDELPSEDQGVTVLRVDARGATLVRDAGAAVGEQPGGRARWKASLDADGGARIVEEITVSGQAAPEWREHYQTPGERQERFGKVWNGRFPGATLEIGGASTAPRTATGRWWPARWRRCPGWPSRPAAGRLRLPVSAREADFVRTYARLSRGGTSYLLAYPWQHEEELRFRLPEGWQVAGLPDAPAAESPFGRFRQEIAVRTRGAR